MKSNKAINIKDVINIFMPLIIVVLLQFMVNIADVIIIFARNAIMDSTLSPTESVESVMSNDYNQPMNLAYLSVAQYSVYLIVMGIWFNRSFCKGTTSPVKGMSKKKAGIISIALIVAGVAGQFLTDSLLELIRKALPELFISYDEMVSRVTGAYSSWVMLFSVFLLAPIAEEIIFRGLIFRYSTRLISPFPAIMLNGLLFAIYHGNLIQGTYAFIFGTLLCYIAYTFSSIIPGIILHMALNTSIMLVPESLFFTTKGCIITLAVSTIFFTAIFLLIIKLAGAVRRVPIRKFKGLSYKD